MTDPAGATPVTLDLQAPPRLDVRDLGLVAFLLLAAGTIFLRGIGDYGLWEYWEPKYGLAMRQMFERGDFITPWLDGKPRWTKPIGIYWAMYLPMKIWGNTPWSARLPSVISATAIVLVLYFWLRRVHGRGMAFMAGAVLVSTPFFAYMARQAMPDMLLTLGLAVTMAGYGLAREGGPRARACTVLAGAGLGLAMLAKGPLAPVIALLALGIFWLPSIPWSLALKPRAAVTELRGSMRANHVGAGVLACLAVAAPWYVLVTILHGGAYIDSFFRGENLHRFAEPVRHHHGTIEYYLRMLCHGAYPWVGFLPVGLCMMHAGVTTEAERRRRWYYISWALAPFLVVTFAGTKISHYILPFMPAFGILVALVWQAAFVTRARWMRAACATSLLFTWIAFRDFKLEGTHYAFDVFNTPRSIYDPRFFPILQIMLVGWGAVMVAGILGAPARWLALPALLVALHHLGGMVHEIIPAHSVRRTVSHLVDLYVANRTPEAKLFFYGSEKDSMAYHGQPVGYEEAGSQQIIRHCLEDHPSFVIVADEAMWRLVRELERGTKKDWFRADIAPCATYVIISDYAPIKPEVEVDPNDCGTEREE